MIRKDLTIRYACGSYWIISTDVHLYADASQNFPRMNAYRIITPFHRFKPCRLYIENAFSRYSNIRTTDFTEPDHSPTRPTDGNAISGGQPDTIP